MTPQPIHVMAGVVRDADGRVLLAQRPPGRPLAGLWEFPGGKRAPDESRLAALARELREELGIEIHDARPLIATTHPDPAMPVRLDVWEIERCTGTPEGLEGQSLAWVPPAELPDWPMPEADRPAAVALRLPTRYAITPEPEGDVGDFLERFERLLAGGPRLVQLRAKALDARAYAALAERCAVLAAAYGAELLLNGHVELAAALDVGVHLPAAELRACTEAGSARAAGASRRWLAASCHDACELALAARSGCDFATLAPVAPTASHPAAAAMGWLHFAALLADAALPVYALGGLTEADELRAREHGARGIAAIRAFWPADAQP